MSGSSASQSDLHEPLLRPAASRTNSAKAKRSDELETQREWSSSVYSLRRSEKRKQWLCFGSGAILAFALSAVLTQTLWWSSVGAGPRGDTSNNAFPDPEEIGYRGPTKTGIEAFVVQTAAALPKLQHHYPVEAGHGNISAEFLFSNSGNLAPPRSIPSWGLPDASEKIPDQCQLDQVQILHRHGQRYPTTGTSTEGLARKITEAGSSFDAQGPMSFLKDWSYPLGTEILTPAGRLQLFQLGATTRLKYGGLLDRMRSLSHKPVFRTTSQDRMLHSALNFAAGFFGIPYETQYHQEVTIEGKSSVNNTLIAQQNCPNEGKAVNLVGNTKAREWINKKFASTAKRLQQLVHGIDLTPYDVVAMLQECSYETVSLGYSSFCPLFTYEDFEAYGYYFDLFFHYNNGFGSPVSAALGKGWVEEVISRLSGERITSASSSVNTTLSSSPVYFPLDQTIYVDASHDTSITAILVTMNFTSLAKSGALPTDHIPKDLAWRAADISPFATALTGQIMSCGSKQGASEKYIRWVLNDGVLPLTGVRGCPQDQDGLCPLETWLGAMRERTKSIDFHYDCFADYEASDKIINGRPPHKY